MNLFSSKLLSRISTKKLYQFLMSNEANKLRKIKLERTIMTLRYMLDYFFRLTNLSP
jgi:hypothetical protein